MSDHPPAPGAGSVPPGGGASDDEPLDATPDRASAEAVLGAGAPGWAALARVLAGEPAAEVPPNATTAVAAGVTPGVTDAGSAGVDDAGARRWLAAHPDEAARLAALDRLVGAAMDSAPVAAAPVDVEAALARVTARRLADMPAGRTAPVPPTVAPAVTVPPGAAPPTPPARRTPTPAWAARPPARQWGRRRLASGAAVAALLLAGAGLALWWPNRGGEPPVATGFTAPQHYATAVGQRDSVRLPDGTRVLLGPASTLDVPAGYNGTARSVALEGEAFFQVPHDGTRPFVVQAGPAAVHDLGTAFTVRRDGPDRVSVAVTEGAVRLSAAPAPASVTQPPTQRPSGRPAPPPPPPPPHPPAAGSEESSVVLRAGERGAVTPGPGRAFTATRLARPAADDTAWTSGRLVFRDAPLPEVASALRRWYGVDLRVPDSALANRHLTANFRNEPLGNVLRVVGLALGARLDRQGDTVFVRAPR